MNALIAAVRVIDRINEVVGRAVAFLTLGAVLVFLLGAGYTLLHGGHVRVDILYARMSPRRRAAVDLAGTMVFLLPWLGVLLYYGTPFLLLSWRLLEPSAQSDGLPGYFLLKSVIPTFCLLVGLQGLSLAGRSLLVLAGREEFAPAQRGR